MADGIPPNFEAWTAPVQKAYFEARKAEAMAEARKAEAVAETRKAEALIAQAEARKTELASRSVTF
jgi:hypothetical protein